VTLEAHVRVERPGHVLDAAVTAAPGDVVAVVGPNGAGKSTLLRAVAGIQPLSGGRVACSGRTWEDPAAGIRVSVPERRVGMVLQDILLFPHLSARDNVAFGPVSRGTPRRQARLGAQRWLDRMGVGELAGRRPAQLSGGQAQRVAVARALAGDPTVLLLDEPLAALDVGVAMTLRLELARHLAAYDGITLLVTHDALDALTLANRVVVLDDGRVVQEGAPQEVARLPRSSHVARLVGLNVLTGHSRGTRIELGDGSHVVTTEKYDGPVNATFSPAAVTVGLETPTSSARNQWRGRVVSVTPHGLAVRVHVDAVGGLLADVTAESAAALGLVPGREVWAAVKATEVDVFPERGRSPAPIA
jgi:molybdate transport system ATP-binding protein